MVIGYWLLEIMGWSKVKTSFRKPLGWWCCKVLCELGWWIRENVAYSYGDEIYYKYLYLMEDKYRINLFGERL